jgi:hypothetical protein
MLPQANDSPAHAPELSEIACVSRTISGDFGLPELGDTVPPRWESEAVPEVAVHENRQSCAPKDHVGAAGKRSYVFHEAVASLT